MNIRNAKAFTLLELLMVVIIIGILATVAMPQYEKFREKAVIAGLVDVLGAKIRAVKMEFSVTPNSVFSSSGSGLVPMPPPNDDWDYTFAVFGNVGEDITVWVGGYRERGPYADTTIQLVWFSKTDTFSWEGTHPLRPQN